MDCRWRHRSTLFRAVTCELLFYTSICNFFVDLFSEISDDSNQPLDIYCKEQVLKMGECAEGAHVQLGILPTLLQAHCNIYMLYPGDTLNAIHHCTGINIVGRSIGTVPLLYRPGHYDLLYDRHHEQNTVSNSFQALSIAPSTTISTKSEPKPSLMYAGEKNDCPTANTSFRCFDDKNESSRSSGVLVSTSKINDGSWVTVPVSVVQDSKQAFNNGFEMVYHVADSKQLPEETQSTESPQSNTMLSQSALEELTMTNIQIDVYNFLVGQLGLPSDVVVDAIVTYHNESLIIVIELIYLLINRKDFRRSMVSNSHPLIQDLDLPNTITKCINDGYSMSDVLGVIARDFIFEEKNIKTRIEMSAKIDRRIWIRSHN
jgi:hypothetical protein